MNKDIDTDGDDKPQPEPPTEQVAAADDDYLGGSLGQYADAEDFDNDELVTCEIHGETLPAEDAREQGWRLEQDGYKATVCRRFVDDLTLDKMEREQFE